MKRLLVVLCIIGLLAGGGFGAYRLALKLYWNTPQPFSEAKDIFIEKGTTSRRIIAGLAEKQVITHPFLFRLFASAEREAQRYKAGEYRIEPHLTPHDISRLLVEGKVIQRSLTVPEGWLSSEALALINAELLLSGSLTEPVAEGALLPETYFFVRNQARGEVLRHMRGAMQKALNDAWEARADTLPFTTPQEALILASIVEKETGLSEERPHIAAVFINRLRLGMPLQSDPTANYGLYKEQGSLKTRLTRDDIAHSSPYNTYLIKGLPPAPICNPGLASIRAVLHPLTSDDLYFVVDGKGGHVFAATLEAHNHNVALYRKALQMKEN